MARLIQAGSDPRLYKVDTSGILLPFQVPIPKTLTDGTQLIVFGKVADTFSINLMKGECSSGGFPEPGCLIHFNPRPNKKVVVINSAVDGKWQKEERKGHSFPFSKGGDFKVVIRMQTLGYQILVDGYHFCDFDRKGTECSKAKYIHIKGDVHIKSVEVRYPSSGAISAETSKPSSTVTCLYAHGQSGKSSGSLAYFHMDTK